MTTPAPVRRPWDVALSVALTVVLAALAVVLGVAGAFLVMVSDSCGSGGTVCAEDRLSAGVLVAALGPAVVTVVAVVAVVVRLVRSRRAFWVPIIGVAVAGLVWAAGVALAFGAVPS